MLRKEKRNFLDGNNLFFNDIYWHNLNDPSVAAKRPLSAKVLKNEKSRLRKLLISRRKNLSKIQIKSKSLSISRSLFLLQIFKKSQNIALYSDINSEVSTKKIFEGAISEGKKLYFPKVVDNSLNFYLVNDFSELGPGYKNILEPGSEAKKISKNDIDLILIPGLGFDIEGNRLGYGGGFFDKYLKNMPRHKSVALAFDFQILKHVPTSSHDVKVGWIITESRAVNCRDTKGGL